MLRWKKLLYLPMVNLLHLYSIYKHFAGIKLFEIFCENHHLYFYDIFNRLILNHKYFIKLEIIILKSLNAVYSPFKEKKLWFLKKSFKIKIDLLNADVCKLPMSALVLLIWFPFALLINNFYNRFYYCFKFKFNILL